MGLRSLGYALARWANILDKPASFPASNANSLLANIAVGQNATIAIALGIREVTVTGVSGAVAGDRYVAFCRSYRLNGGAVTAGRPAGYTVLDCACNIANQITVSVNAPLLAIGASYQMNCDIVKVNT